MMTKVNQNNGKEKMNVEMSRPTPRPELFIGEVQLGVSLTAFMTAVDFFFIGLLLTGSADLQVRLRVPLAFLFLSAFGFLYSTLIYANAGGEVARLNKNAFDKQTSIGNILSEYFGVYGLTFAVPLVVLGYSPDQSLAVIVALISFGGWLVYHLLGYSIVGRYVQPPAFFAIVASTLLFFVCGFTAFIYNMIFAYYIFAGLITLEIIALAIICAHRNER